METERRWNVNDLTLYTEPLADWERRYTRRPKMLQKPYVLWGRLNFDVGSDKVARVLPSVSEQAVTLCSCASHKLDAKFKRGWRILKYWVPKKHELEELGTDDVQHGWRFQYATDPKGFSDIAKNLEYYKQLGEGNESTGKVILENVNLKAKVEELSARLKDGGSNKASR
jgi:hypothetical protein